MFFSGENTPKLYHCAIYARLSQDDPEASGDSESIQNQKLLLHDFIDHHEDLVLVGEYADDGYSGVNFNRPDFQRMMEDVRAGLIDCVICKDLSRLGRNYIEVGRYLEQIFPSLGTRFIAVNDNVDTARAQSDAEQFVLPFRNLFNDSYSRDMSVKVRSQLEVKRKHGDFVGSFASYGYLKDPGNNNKLVIDPEAAETIRYIFSLKIQGLSADRIADILNSQGILCPMEYKRNMGLNVSTHFRTGDKAKWNPVSVLRILKNELYIGVTTQGRYTTPSYKIRNLVEKPPSQWDRVEDTHEPIISRDVFDAVQALLLRDTRISPSDGQASLFSGYLICADCKLNMVRYTARRGEKVYIYYCCSGARRHSCTPHSISEKLIYRSVLSAVREMYLLVMDISRLLKYAQELPDDPHSLHRFEVQLAHLDDEIRHNQDMKIRLVENLNEGVLTREDYVELSGIYDRRIREARLAIKQVEAERDGYKDLPVEGEWLVAFKKYGNITSLDRVLLADLIDVIEVHNDKRLTVRFKFQDQIQRVSDYLSERGLTPQPQREEVSGDGEEKQEGTAAAGSASPAG